jgi:hypothetical protein
VGASCAEKPRISADKLLSADLLPDPERGSD